MCEIGQENILDDVVNEWMGERNRNIRGNIGLCGLFLQLIYWIFVWINPRDLFRHGFHFTVLSAVPALIGGGTFILTYRYRERDEYSISMDE